MTTTIKGTSQTVVVTQQVVEEQNNIVHLKQQSRRIQWEEGTIDNEHMNKKKSSRCCIYHKPRKFDESSDESGSDCDEEHCKKSS